MKKQLIIGLVILITIISVAVISSVLSIKGFKAKRLTPEKGVLTIPVVDINNGKAHFFKVKSSNGIDVVFFVLKSSDGVIRSAIDACDVCYRSGKGYVQDGDFMVCGNCGRRFASSRINEVKGGCNPAPLNRKIIGSNLLIAMADIDENSWYCKYK